MKEVQKICKAKNIKVKYGLNIYDNLIIWIYDGDMGNHKAAHNTIEYHCIWFVIEYLVQNINKIRELDESEAIFRMVNEFWYDHWNQERKWRDRFHMLKKIMINIHKKKKVGIFGAGKKAVFLSNELLHIREENSFNIQYVFDNDIKKRGYEFQGIPIIHPSDIIDWKDWYIIITSDVYDEEIKKQLENYGLCWEKDFVSCKEFYY